MDTKSFETLKQAARIVAGIIQEKTPPIFSNCRKAYSDLGDLVAYSSRSTDEGVSLEFATAIDAVIKRLEAFRARCVKAEGEPTKMSMEEFAVYFKEQVEKALEEEPAPSLRRLHALHEGIEKAVISYTSEPGVQLVRYTDPWQQASVQREGNGAPVVTSGAAQAGEVKATPGISVDEVIKSTIASVDKAAQESREIQNYGWSHDLTSDEFMKGERKVDFGRDGTK